MPIINLEDLNKVKIKVTTRYELMLDDFNEKIELEEKKYPLSDREQMLVTTIRELLNALDESCRRW